MSTDLKKLREALVIAADSHKNGAISASDLIIASALVDIAESLQEIVRLRTQAARPATPKKASNAQ
jgi:hypothetical protein